MNRSRRTQQNWHTRVLPAVCNVSNKSAKRNTCAARRAPTPIALGLIVPLCSYYQPKTDRTPNRPKLSYNSSMGTCRSRMHLENNISWYLDKANAFDMMPKTPNSYETYLYTAGCKIPGKTAQRRTAKRSPALETDKHR